jgi:hypothetical protein
VHAPEILPSILACDLARLGDEVAPRARRPHAPLRRDGRALRPQHLVRSAGDALAAGRMGGDLDVHLMIVDPSRYAASSRRQVRRRSRSTRRSRRTDHARRELRAAGVRWVSGSGRSIRSTASPPAPGDRRAPPHDRQPGLRRPGVPHRRAPEDHRGLRPAGRRRARVPHPGRRWRDRRHDRSGGCGGRGLVRRRDVRVRRSGSGGRIRGALALADEHLRTPESTRLRCWARPGDRSVAGTIAVVAADPRGSGISPIRSTEAAWSP